MCKTQPLHSSKDRELLPRRIVRSNYTGPVSRNISAKVFEVFVLDFLTGRVPAKPAKSFWLSKRPQRCGVESRLESWLQHQSLERVQKLRPGGMADGR